MAAHSRLYQLCEVCAHYNTAGPLNKGNALADVPGWMRFTPAEATEALLSSAKLRPAEVAQLRAAEAARAQGQAGTPQAAAEDPTDVAGPSKARRKSRQAVSFQVFEFFA